MSARRRKNLPKAEVNPGRPRWPAWLPALVLVSVTLIVYLPVTQCGFIWDDDFYVQNNRTLGDGDGLRRIWFEFGATQDYYPLTFTTFWIEWWMWGLRPPGYHLNNILLHALNALLLWRLLVRLGVPGALLAALLFAVHPVHVDSVAWITERKNMLSGLFCLSSLHAFVSFDRLDEPAEAAGERRWKFYGLSLAAFLLAMLAKTVVVPLPLIFPVLAWWKRGRLGRRDLLPVIPYFVVIAPLFAVAFVEKANFGGAGVNILSADPGDWGLSLRERVLLCGRVLWFYVGKLLWPQPLIFVYPRWQIDSQVWWQYLYPLTAAAVPLVLWRLRNRIGRGPLAAALVFGLMLAPASGFFNFYFQRFSYVADHLQYLASIAVTTLLAAMAAQAMKHYPAYRLWGASLAIALLAVLAAQSWRHQATYRNQQALWTDTLAKNPACWLAHTNWAAALRYSGRIDEAAEHYEDAVRLKPDDAQSHYNWGVILHDLRRFDEAAVHFREVLRIKPDFAEAHNTWGTALANLGRFENAVMHYQEALKIKPEFAEAHYNWGVALSLLQRFDEAGAQYREALRLKPDYAEAHYDWGNALAKLGRADEAMAHYREALRINPNYAEAHYNLGVTLLGLGSIDQAVAHYQQALRARPDFAEAHNNLGVALHALGRIDEAVAHYRETLRIKPDYAEAHYNWGRCLIAQGRVPDAMKRFQQAVRLKPDLTAASDELRQAEALLEQKNGPAGP